MTVLTVVLSPIASASGHHVPPGSLWYRDAVCETGHIGEPGDGKPRWDWGKPPAPGHHYRHLEGPNYEGGIGFYPPTWREWAGRLGVLAKYPHAYLAPDWVQAEVAQYGYSNFGKWGCLYQVT